MKEEAESIAETLTTELDKLPEVHPNAKLMLPAIPIMQAESNWPLLTVSKGFFEGHMAMKSN